MTTPVRRETYYLCIGHPAWPDPLRVYSEEKALEWLREHRDKHPVRVDKVVQFRLPLLDPEDPTTRPIRYGEETGLWSDLGPDPCPDCGVQIGEEHLGGCDIERCHHPNLATDGTQPQRISCQKCIEEECVRRGHDMIDGECQWCGLPEEDR